MIKNNSYLDPYLILDNLFIGVFVLELESLENKELRIIYSNEANSTIVGTDMKATVGKTLREAFPAVYEQSIPDLYIQAITTQKTVPIGEIVYEDKNVAKQIFLLEAVPLTETIVMVKIENVSLLRAAEEELRIKNLHLLAKNKELEQFVYIASHDLQEPLNSIKNFSDVLNKKYLDRLDEKANKILTIISQAASRMSSLVKGLLDYSRIGQKEDILSIDTNLLVKQISEDFASLINQTNAVIKTEQLPTIKAAYSDLRVLFQNLISNGIKFHKKGISPQINIKAVEDNGFWKFSFEDNGIGIKEEYKKKIFLIFQRLHNKDEFEGTGIGLSHCQKVVELYGGELWVESVLGEGSTFYFTIKK